VSRVRNGHCATRTSDVPWPGRMNRLARPSGHREVFCSLLLCAEMETPYVYPYETYIKSSWGLYPGRTALRLAWTPTARRSAGVIV
jgi:hypothetical protein